ncbi:hypothetical protein HYC85_003777 [Camellia sinensis]|uniref:Peptidase A1 domain-containing protein n=1 Tax=Camellia sinensis TaxID=4442 RepID=A0A7J7HUM3_CAMSI|nr:hypothetical protein HYC85_003777 [Camellia sinensis]
MDSGSNLVWIQCAPCIKCPKQLTPLSSSYRNQTCISCYCQFDPQQTYCDSVGICAYNGNYVDTISTRGILGMEEVRTTYRRSEKFDRWTVATSDSPQHSKSDRLCYMGEVSRDLKGFPVITFHFAGGADLVLDVDTMFVQLQYTVTPASEEDNLTIIGIRAQQYYNFAYDLDAMKLYFQRIDCQLVED